MEMSSDQRARVRAALFVALIVVAMPMVAPLRAATAEDRILYTQTPDAPPDGLELRFLDPATGSSIMRSHIISDAGWRASPDGTKLVLINFSGLRLADADGSNPVPLTDTIPGEQHQFPAWSPQGDRIAFLQRSAGAAQVMIIDSEPGSAPVSLTDPMPDVRPEGLDWSPDGATLVWSWSANNTSGIELITIADGTTAALGTGRWPRFSPDGATIAFVSGGGSSQIGIMDASGANRVIHPQEAQMLAWSPDGTSIAWSSRHLLGIYDPDTEQSQLLITGNPSETNLYVADWAGVVLPTFTDVAYDHTFSADIEWAATERITRGCNPPANDRFCPRDSITRGQLAAFFPRALDLPPAPGDAFIDDSGTIFEDDINRLAAAKITKGCNPPTNDRFCPDSKVTREQMAAFLVRAIGYADDGGGNLFIDDDDSIFENDIDKLGTAGVTKGCNPPTNNLYCPNNVVTRGQMAAFLHRALG